jgi:hypothetical protein
MIVKELETKRSHVQVKVVRKFGKSKVRTPVQPKFQRVILQRQTQYSRANPLIQELWALFHGEALRVFVFVCPRLKPTTKTQDKIVM